MVCGDFKALGHTRVLFWLWPPTLASLMSRESFYFRVKDPFLLDSLAYCTGGSKTIHFISTG